ncbi:MAG: YraN family protein [Candidatus Babeliaceae bacterium]|nr:YraN family protein [Candidatus Babeliaceae bacterium]
MAVRIDHRKATGRMGEEMVADYLVTRGFVISRRNFFCRGGEIDIVAQNRTHRLFVEVKTRLHAYFATSEVVNGAKQKKIIAAAYRYNAENQHECPLVYRFDVAILEREGEMYTLNYIENAFAPSMELL